MSTGLDCSFAHLTTKHGTGWFYFLETYPVWGPDGGDYESYGPFPSFGEAYNHLHDHHANPGGYSMDPEPAPPRDPTAFERSWLEPSHYRGNR